MDPVLEGLRPDTLAVGGAGGIGVSGGEPVIDARGAETGFFGEEFQAAVLHVVPAERPPAAVDVKVDAGGLAVGTDDAHLYRPSAAGDLDVPRLLQEDRRGKDALPLPPRPARDLGWHGLHRRLGGDKGFELRVESARLVDVLLLDLGRGGRDPGHPRPVLPPAGRPAPPAPPALPPGPVR